VSTGIAAANILVSQTHIDTFCDKVSLVYESARKVYNSERRRSVKEERKGGKRKHN
jgi:hypothetical protein